MNRDPDLSMEDLSQSTEEEYGGGSELSTTGFVIFGLLTFWIYTVWNYYRVLESHLAQRLRYFTERLDRQELTPRSQDVYATIVEKGFTDKRHPKYIAILFYFLSMALMVYLAVFKFFTGDIDYGFDMFIVFSAALCFCGATIYFLSNVCRNMKSHEYQELLLLKLTHEGDDFRVVQPSNRFVKRWNRHQGWIAFFLVLSIPMTISPVIAVSCFYAAWNDPSISVDAVSIAWIAIVLAFAAVFHLWGLKILIGMYNGHLRVEAVNRQAFTESRHWMSESTASVVGRERYDEAERGLAAAVPDRLLAAIMITDMVGFSSDMESDEESTYAKLIKHNEIIRKHVQGNRGEEIKTMGDAFLVRFKSAVDAVKAAMGIQADFSAFNRGKEESERIMVRIGIHIGDVLIMGRDVIGNGVNVASRIEPLAEAGGICISADVYNVVRKSVDLKVLSLGKQDLKNIRDVPEIYKVVLESIS